MDMGETADRYNGYLNFDTTLRVLCFLCPFLTTLDLSHQFVKVFLVFSSNMQGFVLIGALSSSL